MFKNRIFKISTYIVIFIFILYIFTSFSDLDINCRAILGLLSELKNKNLNRSFILLVLKVSYCFIFCN